MDITVKNRGYVTKGGKLNFDNQPLFTDVVNRMRDKRFELIIKEEEKEISLDSYAYYWGVVLKIAYDSEQYNWLNNSEAIHYQVFAPKFLSYEKVVKTSKGMKKKVLIRDIKDLNQNEMSDFITRVVADLADEDIIILDPSQVEIPKRYKT